MEKTIEKLKKLRVDALLGKKKHFNASDRKSKYNIRIGIPLITINLFTSSVIAFLISNSGSLFLKYIIMCLSFIGGLLAIYQTFFGFQKQIEGHRNLGNRYLSIVKDIELTIALYEDKKMSEDEFVVRAFEINKNNELANKESELYPTNSKDFFYAKESINRGEETYTQEELNY